MVNADGQFERLIAGAADPRQVHVADKHPVVGIVVADAVEDAFDDVDVMLSPIQATHTVG